MKQFALIGVDLSRRAVDSRLNLFFICADPRESAAKVLFVAGSHA